jgi:hypothetical protein
MGIALKSHPKGDTGVILDGESALSKVCKRGVSDTFIPFSGGEKRLFKLSAALDGGQIEP